MFIKRYMNAVVFILLTPANSSLYIIYKPKSRISSVLC